MKKINGRGRKSKEESKETWNKANRNPKKLTEGEERGRKEERTCGQIGGKEYDG